MSPIMSLSSTSSSSPSSSSLSYLTPPLLGETPDHDTQHKLPSNEDHNCDDEVINGTAAASLTAGGEAINHHAHNNGNSIGESHTGAVAARNGSGSSSSSNGGDADSRNIPLTLSFFFFAFLSRSLWSQSVLSAYVYLLRDGDPQSVGLITAVMGLSQLLTSAPSGALADRHRRDTLLRIGSVLGAISIVVTVTAVTWNTYVGLTVALAVWGMFWGVASTCASALFADSVPGGRRSEYFTRRVVLQRFAASAGPLVAMVMFVFLGDEWTVRDCGVVIVVAQIVGLPSVVLQCLFSDDYAINGSKHDVTVVDDGRDRVPADETDDSHDGRNRDEARREEHCPEVGSAAVGGACPGHHPDQSNNGGDATSDNGGSSLGDEWSALQVNLLDDEDRARDDSEVHGGRRCCFWRRGFRLIPNAETESRKKDDRTIAVLVASADVLAGLASGMSIRYFPIFFLDHLQLSPAVVQLLYVSSPLCQTLLSKLCHRGGRMIGRCQMTCAFKWTGASMMLLMVAAHNYGLPNWIVCVLYVLRTAFRNSTGALTKSVLMDAVPKNQRGKWSALESVNMFSWSGSSALGGWLVARRGVEFNFLVTAGMQFAATLPLVALFGRVPAEGAGESAATTCEVRRW